MRRRRPPAGAPQWGITDLSRLKEDRRAVECPDRPSSSDAVRRRRNGRHLPELTEDDIIDLDLIPWVSGTRYQSESVQVVEDDLPLDYALVWLAKNWEKMVQEARDLLREVEPFDEEDAQLLPREACLRNTLEHIERLKQRAVVAYLCRVSPAYRAEFGIRERRLRALFDRAQKEIMEDQETGRRRWIEPTPTMGLIMKHPDLFLDEPEEFGRMRRWLFPGH